MLALYPLGAHLFIGGPGRRASLRRSGPDLDAHGESVDVAEQIRALLDRSPSPTCTVARWSPAVIMDLDVVPARIRPSDQIARVA